MPLVEWDGNKLKEYKGELDDAQHAQKQKGFNKWKDLFRKDEQNPDIAVERGTGRLFVRLRVSKSKAEEDDRTIYDDGGTYWGEL